jgi:hypothetical protein
MLNHTITDYASALFAFLAAILWFRSSLVKIPGMTCGKPEDNPMHMTLHSAAKLNASAALCAALAAVRQGVGAVLS